MRAEQHVPHGKHDTEVGVSQLWVGSVVDAVKLGSDSEAVHECRNRKADIGMSRESRNGHRNELPVDQPCRRSDNEQWKPDGDATPEGVQDVMARPFEGMKTHRRVVKRV